MAYTNYSGYVIERLLSDEDLHGLRRRINAQIHRVLKQCDPKAASQIKNEEDPLSIYHLIKSQAKHGSNWVKTNRLLNEADSEWFENSNSIANLRSRLGAIRISDEECIGRSNYYWRMTRPMAYDDVGPVHRDEWFWILNNNFNEDLKGLKRVKIWIAIQVIPGKNGLLVEPGSQKREDLEWEGRSAGNIIKPVLLTDLDPKSMVLLDTLPGFGVIFDDKLLHGGALNQAEQCRCSIEFTMLVPNQSF